METTLCKLKGCYTDNTRTVINLLNIKQALWDGVVCVPYCFYINRDIQLHHGYSGNKPILNNRNMAIFIVKKLI